MMSSSMSACIIKSQLSKRLTAEVQQYRKSRRRPETSAVSSIFLSALMLWQIKSDEIHCNKK